eukprot:732010-Pyramimonas_sp.AAC.1
MKGLLSVLSPKGGSGAPVTDPQGCGGGDPPQGLPGPQGEHHEEARARRRRAGERGSPAGALRQGNVTVT